MQKLMLVLSAVCEGCSIQQSCLTSSMERDLLKGSGKPGQLFLVTVAALLEQLQVEKGAAAQPQTSNKLPTRIFIHD